MMLVYHVAWDLKYFGYFQGSITTGGWYWFQHATVTGFVFIAGVALWLSYAVHGRTRFGRYFNRGLKILGWGFVITLVTHLTLREGTVLFGVLHLIGFSVICAFPFLRLGRANLIFGLAFILLGSLLRRVAIDYPWVAWLGLRPVQVYMVDYVPVFPWFGVVLLGIGTGAVLYAGGVRLFSVPAFGCRRPMRLLAFLGQNSLFIYLVHQPVLFGLFWIGGFFTQLLRKQML